MLGFTSGRRDKQLAIERRTVTRDPATGAQVPTWSTLVSPVWAEIIESATAGDEGQASNVQTAARPTRVRINWRPGLDATMRLRLADGRLLQIIGMAELGRREGIEFACKGWSHE